MIIITILLTTIPIIITTRILRDYIAGNRRDLAVEEEVGRRDRGKRRKLGEE